MFHRGSMLKAAVLAFSLGALALPSCGAKMEDPESAVDAKNEERAQRSLDRAREVGEPDRFRRIISRFPETKAASDARDELAKILVAQAQAAMKKEDWVTAEERALEAKRYGGVDMTLKATEVLNEIDDQRATKIAEDATGEAAEGKCASALKTIAATIRKKPRERYTIGVRKQTRAPMLACLEKKLVTAVAENNIEQARMMIETPDATTAFSNEGYKDAHAILEKAIVAKSTTEIQPLLATQKWEEAIAKLDELRQKDVLNPREREVAFGIVQDAIAAHLVEVLTAGLTAKNPKEIAAEADAGIKIAKWKALPEAVEDARNALGVNIQCELVKCRLQAKPANLWAWGKVPLYPPTNHEGSKLATIKHAQKLWVIGKGAKWALVTRKDPGQGALADLLKKADGWSPTEDLKASDTEEWLPPRDQMKGVRIWGPLLEKNKKEWILGIVTKVDGNKLTAKRLTDGLEAEVDWKDVRLGTLPSGLKVQAFCEDQIHRETARVDKVVSTKGEVPKVKVKCDQGGIERVEIASALTTQPGWLPRRRP